MTDTLTVHRLRLVADQAAYAPRLAARVEDALRIATRPPALAHAYVLIRRLRVTVTRDGASQGIALLLEREWARLLTQAQPMAEAWDSAELVWAADEVAARRALLARWLAGETPTAWFWERLAPGAAASTSLPQRMAGLLTAPWQDAAQGAAQSERWWRSAMPPIERHGHADAVVALLPPVSRQRLIATWRADGGAAQAVSLLAEGKLTPPMREASHAAGVRGNVAGRPPVDEAASHGMRRSPAFECLDAATLAERPGRAAPPPPSAPARLGPATVGADNGARAETATPPCVAEHSPATRPAHLGFSARSDLRGRPTDWAGLWFLLPLLQRSGYAREASGLREAASERDAARLVLLLEAAREAFALDAVTGDWIAGRRDLSAHVLAACDLDVLQAEASSWWRHARLACARDARMPLRRLLRRNGEALVTPHRVDLVLPLRTTDIRIRRAGYDLDPGYMPWLDLVLRFHYA